MRPLHTRVKPRPLARLSLLVALLLVAASACGEVDDLQVLTEAAQATTADDTARFTLETDLTGSAFGGGLRTSAEGELDFSANRMRMTMAVGPEGGGMEIDALFDGDTGASYLRDPMLAGDGPQWLRLDAADMGLDAGSLDAWGEAGDPVTMLEQLEHLATEVVEAGEDTVRGESATHYRMVLDYGAALDEVEDDEMRDMLARQMAAMGLTELPAEVWVDEQGRVVRFTQEIDLGQADPAEMHDLLGEQFEGFDLPDSNGMPTELEGVQVVTMEFFDFGAEVRIELPADDDTFSISDLGIPGAQGP